MRIDAPRETVNDCYNEAYYLVIYWDRCTEDLISVKASCVEESSVMFVASTIIV